MRCLLLLVFNDRFKFQNSICCGCPDLTMLCLNISNIAVITIKGVDYCHIIHDISKCDKINFLEYFVLDDLGIYKMNIKESNIKSIVYSYYFDNLIRANKIETENILIDVKNYKDLVAYFTRYVHQKLIKMLSLYYYDLIGKIEKHAEIKMFDGWWLLLEKVLDKIREVIVIRKFDDTKILIDTNNKLPDDITLKNDVILMKTCVIKGGSKFYP